MIREHNVTTDEVIDREMTDAEYGLYEERQLADAISAELQAKVEADKAVLLDKLGITADEARLLLS